MAPIPNCNLPSAIFVSVRVPLQHWLNWIDPLIELNLETELIELIFWASLAWPNHSHISPSWKSLKQNTNLKHQLTSKMLLFFFSQKLFTRKLLPSDKGIFPGSTKLEARPKLDTLSFTRQCDRDAATRSRGSSEGPGDVRFTSNQNRSTKRTSTQCKTQRKQPSKSLQLEEFQFFWPFWMSSWRDFTWGHSNLARLSVVVGKCPKISLIVKCSGPKALSGRLFSPISHTALLCVNFCGSCCLNATGCEIGTAAASIYFLTRTPRSWETRIVEMGRHASVGYQEHDKGGRRRSLRNDMKMTFDKSTICKGSSCWIWAINDPQ